MVMMAGAVRLRVLAPVKTYRMQPHAIPDSVGTPISVVELPKLQQAPLESVVATVRLSVDVRVVSGSV